MAALARETMLDSLKKWNFVSDLGANNPLLLQFQKRFF